MVLQKLQMCDPSHQKEFQYCCIKENKVFCGKCWFKTEHFRACQSSRCGNYQKLAHLVINRALEFKNIYYLQNMSTNYQKFQNSRIKALQLNYQITELMKQWVQQKIPLFLWAMMNEMLHSKYSQQASLNCNKYDSMCTQMLKTIKNSDPSKKPEYLEMTVANFHTINHELEGNLNSLKSQSKQFSKSQNKQQKIEQVMQFCRRNLGLLLVNIKTSMKEYVESQITKALSNFDSSIKFKGVSFPKVSNQIGIFKKKEHYRNMSLNTELFSKISSKSQQNQIYNGYYLSVPELESNPQQILQLSKSFIKQKLYTLYSSIQTFKSSYPYKYAYPISTCLEPDQEYQCLVLDLEKSYIKSIQSKSKHPFVNSLSIIVMGPQTIVIRFMNRPQFCYTMKIYNYKKSRQPYYKKLKQILGLNDFKQKSQADSQKNIQFTQQPTLLQLAYINFRIAYQQIFIGQNIEQKIFQGQKVTSNRGMQLFVQVIQKWKLRAKVELQFSVPQEQIIQMII